MWSVLNQYRISAILALILIWAGALRLWQCNGSLPGLQIDEAANAWNAYCLLMTGKDEWGQPWPLFSTRSFDHHRSTLYLYLLLPFQAMGGLNVCTTRLPAATGGIVSILLIYYLGRRLFDAPTGLLAAVFVAVCPWHIQYSRWGNESSVVPFLLAASFAALLWAGAPCIDRPVRSKPSAGLFAGVVAGLSCYGYGSLRVVLPVTVLLACALTWRAWPNFIRQTSGRRTFIAIVIGFVLTLGPLAFKHLTDPRLNQRSHETLVWDADDSSLESARKVLARYVPHFGPKFLFVEGSTDPALSPPQGYGWLHWYSLPLLAMGGGWIIWHSRQSLSARLLLIVLLCYPAADVIFGQGTAPHPLRGYGGIIPLALTAAVGAVVAVRWLAARSRQIALTSAGAIALWVLISHVMYLHTFFGRFKQDTGKYWQRHVDLMQACQWLKPRLNEVDAVFITPQMIPFPHVLSLVFLEYDPRQWLAGPREYVPSPPTLQAQVVCSRFGKINFMYDPARSMAELEELRRNERSDRIVMIVRPGQRLADFAPVAEIRHGGLVWLYIYDLEI